MKPIQAVLIGSLITVFNCSKESATPKTTKLSTAAVTSITLTTATSGGTITSDGGKSIMARGICWSINPSPTITLSTKTVDGAGTGTFVSNLEGLTQTIYYVRAYATNSEGTFYGNEVTFDVNDIAVKLTTTKAHNLTGSSVVTGGNISSDGGTSVTARGVCWSTAADPTITSNKTTDGTGTGVFVSSLSGLNTWTKYYVRAYATNGVGTFYGPQIIAVPIPPVVYGAVSDIEGNSYKTVVIGNNTWMAENLKTTKYQDGSPITTGLDNSSWIGSSEGAYMDYNRTSSNGDKFGHLYNGLAASDPRNVCPAGWHVPSAAEWNAMADNLGGGSVAGGRMKDVSDDWASPNLEADNRSGFSGLPGGSFYSAGSAGAGIFSDMGTDGYWWSSDAPTFFYLTNDQTLLRTKSTATQSDGLSIRCVKN